MPWPSHTIMSKLTTVTLDQCHTIQVLLVVGFNAGIAMGVTGFFEVIVR